MLVLSLSLGLTAQIFGPGFGLDTSRFDLGIALGLW